MLLNAAAAIAAHRGGDDLLVDRLRVGWHAAAESLDRGSAAAVLERWVEVSGALRA